MTFEEQGIKTKHNAGTRYATVCPQCSHLRKDTNKRKECLTVNNESGARWYKCNHCFWSGNLDLLERFDKVYQASLKPRGELPKFYSAKVNEFIQNKGLKAETFQKLGIYEPIGEGNVKQRLIAYPYYFKHSLRNVMFRVVDYNSDKDRMREWQINKDNGTESIFWGLDDLDFDHKEIILVEGQTDRITWVECGYKNVLSIPMGGIAPQVKSLENKLAFLNEEFHTFIKPMFTNLELNQSFRFIVCMDNDEVGINTTEILAARLGKQHCYRPFYPNGYKDSNEIYAGDLKKDVQKLGKKGIDDLYKSCKPFQLSGVIKVYEIRESIKNFGRKGIEKGLITGVDHYDKLWSIKPKLLAGFTGIPKMGKTVGVRDYLVNLTRNNPGMKWGMFSPEQRGGDNDVEREYVALAENYAGGKFKENYKTSLTNTQIDKALDWVGDNFFLTNPTRQNFNNFGKDDANPATLQNLFDYFLHLKKTEGIFGFVLDAWNRVEHVKNKGENDEGFVGRELNRILDFLRAYDLACIIVAHPTKMDRLDGKNYDAPQMYNIKGSSAWMERLDIGVSIHRPKLYVNRNEGQRGATAIWDRDNKAYTEIELQILKFQELGSPGKSIVNLDWHKGERFHSFKEPKEEVQEFKEPKPKSDKPKTVRIDASIGEDVDFEESEDPFDTIPF
jgi:twinkle protein